MAKTATEGVTELKAVTERSFVDISTAVKSGQEETTKLRKDVNDYTLTTEAVSKDLFVQLFARLDEMKADSNAHTRELNQLRAENRTYASAACCDRTPRGARLESREGQDNGGTLMEDARKQKGSY